MSGTVDRTVRDLREGAARVLSAVNLESVILVDSEHHSMPQEFDGALKVVYSIEVSSRQGPGAVECQVGYSAFAIPSEVLAEDFDGGSDIHPELIAAHAAWNSESVWVAFFRRTDDTGEEFEPSDLQAFAMLMGPPTVHPYARELLQSLTARSPYAAFTLELLTPLSALEDDEIVEIADTAAE